jgi:hypothetical protein
MYVLDTIYEIWVISRYSWKALEFDLYAPIKGDIFDSLVSVLDLDKTYFAQNCHFKA